MKYTIVLLLIIICSGCSSTAPSHFTVDTTSQLPANILTNHAVNINVTDLRVRQDILQLENDGKFTYIPSQVPTTTFIKQGLTASFNQQLGRNYQSNSNNSIHVNVEKMAVKLNQETFAYDTKSLIVLAVTINNGNKTLNKTFKRQGTSHGPLKADIAVLEQNFNQLLTLLFNDISKDSQVIDYLTGTK